MEDNSQPTHIEDSKGGRSSTDMDQIFEIGSPKFDENAVQNFLNEETATTRTTTITPITTSQMRKSSAEDRESTSVVPFRNFNQERGGTQNKLDSFTVCGVVENDETNHDRNNIFLPTEFEKNSTQCATPQVGEPEEGREYNNVGKSIPFHQFEYGEREPRKGDDNQYSRIGTARDRKNKFEKSINSMKQCIIGAKALVEMRAPKGESNGSNSLKSSLIDYERLSSSKGSDYSGRIDVEISERRQHASESTPADIQKSAIARLYDLAPVQGGARKTSNLAPFRHFDYDRRAPRQEDKISVGGSSSDVDEIIEISHGKHDEKNIEEPIHDDKNASDAKGAGGSRAASGENGSCIPRWLRKHRIEVVGIACIVLGIVIVVGAITNPEKFNLRSSRAQSNATLRPSSSQANMTMQPTKATTPFSSPQPTVATIQTAVPTRISIPTQLPSVHPTGPPIYGSILDRLSQVTSISKLKDNTSPQGTAYLWISEADDAGLSANDPTLIQRYVLATFYFATGGGRTTATWKVCSAVPQHSDASIKNVFQVRCVFDNGTTICASREAFINCTNDSPALAGTNSKRWLSSVSECQWFGVSCDQNGAVVQISLPNNLLKGSLVPELAALLQLTMLNLAGNSLQSTLPNMILQSIQHVNLQNNLLTGTIPESWYSWRDLQLLNLGNNTLTGMVNLTPGSWNQLQFLAFGQNNLTWPDSAILGYNFPLLQMLDASGNALHGSLPTSLGSLKQLLALQLSNCELSGTVPVEIAASQQLGKLFADQFPSIHVVANFIARNLQPFWTYQTMHSTERSQRNCGRSQICSFWS